MTSSARRSRSCSAPTGSTSALLQLLAPDAIRRSAGRLTADLRLTGSWPALRADGVARVSGGELALAATGVTWRDMSCARSQRGRAGGSRVDHRPRGSGSARGRRHHGAGRDAHHALRPSASNCTTSSPSRGRLRSGHRRHAHVEGALAYPVVRGELTLTRLLVRPTVLSESRASASSPTRPSRSSACRTRRAAAEPTAADRRRRWRSRSTSG